MVHLNVLGNGLDTHRLNEILLMGGIPIIRRSSITSCYDDSDNTIVTRGDSKVTRGSLPIVIVKSWDELSRSMLEKEWLRITSHPLSYWDWKRLFVYSWIDRINPSNPNPVRIR